MRTLIATQDGALALKAIKRAHGKTKMVEDAVPTLTACQDGAMGRRKSVHRKTKMVEAAMRTRTASQDYA